MTTDDRPPAPGTTVTEADLPYLRRCVELAAEAVAAGDWPFGSVLVGVDGTVLAEDRNRESSTGDPTRHPEFELARWAALHLAPEERASATVYTSGEHCPMCAAAHGWVGLGRIVYASSARQARDWKAEWGVTATSPLSPLTVQEVVPGLPVAGPVPELAERVKGLQWRFRNPEVSEAD
ncbi:nucleoside deaminase [Streptomyces sp. LP11]|uniref:Nucleoside deaminase n=1 Tax=Streptomyces pyxinicus TaxID=2970331 RepID=A0ABT2BBV4_9ACTN|nr:nucleoside deaminase [Streptomyces sp. LP11]MCS0605866.1 nucleoside deaminase [Streptomyces sp. LP11]